MALKPWIWGSMVVTLGVAAAVIAGFLIDSKQREQAKRLSVELEQRRAEFVRRWSTTRWHDGPPCNALTVASDVLDRATAVDSKETLEELRQEAAPCSEAFALDGLSYKDRPVIDEFRYEKAVIALLVREMERPDCLSGVLDVLDLADALRVGGGVARMVTARDVEWRGLAAGLDCVARSSVEELEPLVDRAVKACARPSYISGAVEWTFLESAYNLQLLFRRRSMIPRFWNPALASLSNGRTLLDGQEKLLSYASRAAATAGRAKARVRVRHLQAGARTRVTVPRGV